MKVSSKHSNRKTLKSYVITKQKNKSSEQRFVSLFDCSLQTLTQITSVWVKSSQVRGNERIADSYRLISNWFLSNDWVSHAFSELGCQHCQQ